MSRCVKVFSRVYQVLGVLVSYGLGGKGGSTNHIYIYISVLVGFPVVFSTLVVVVFGDLAEGKSTSFCNTTLTYFCKVK